MVNLYRDALDHGDCVVEEWRPMNLQSFTWSPYLNHEWDEAYPSKVEMKRLQELARRISSAPEAIEMQSRVAKIYSDRALMASGEKPFDWGSGNTGLRYIGRRGHSYSFIWRRCGAWYFLPPPCGHP